MSFLKKIRTYVCCIVGRLSLQNKFLHFLFTVCIMDLDKIWITMSFFMAKFSLNPWVSISDVPSSSSKTRVSHSLSPAALSSSLSSCPTTKVLDKLSSRSSRDKFWLKRSSTNLWIKLTQYWIRENQNWQPWGQNPFFTYSRWKWQCHKYKIWFNFGTHTPFLSKYVCLEWDSNPRPSVLIIKIKLKVS